MDAEAIVTIGASIVLLVQLCKWAGLPRRWAPLVVFVVSALGVAVWAWSRGVYDRAAAWQLFAAWIAVAGTASGVYGFARQAIPDKADAPPPAA